MLLPPPETALGAGAAEFEEAVGAAATGAGDEAADPALDCVVRLLPEGGALVAAPGAVLPVVLGGLAVVVVRAAAVWLAAGVRCLIRSAGISPVGAIAILVIWIRPKPTAGVG